MANEKRKANHSNQKDVWLKWEVVFKMSRGRGGCAGGGETMCDLRHGLGAGSEHQGDTAQVAFGGTGEVGRPSSIAPQRF